MPIKQCRENGKPGWKYGDSGKCYTYTEGDKVESKRAHKRAEKQANAIHSTGWHEKGREEIMDEHTSEPISKKTNEEIIEQLILELAQIKKEFEELKASQLR